MDRLREWWRRRRLLPEPLACEVQPLIMQFSASIQESAAITREAAEEWQQLQREARPIIARRDLIAMDREPRS